MAASDGNETLGGRTLASRDGALGRAGGDAGGPLGSELGEDVTAMKGAEAEEPMTSSVLGGATEGERFGLGVLIGDRVVGLSTATMSGSCARSGGKRSVGSAAQEVSASQSCARTWSESRKSSAIRCSSVSDTAANKYNGQQSDVDKSPLKRGRTPSVRTGVRQRASASKRASVDREEMQRTRQDVNAFQGLG